MKIENEVQRNAMEKELEKLLETPFANFDEWQKNKYDYLTNAIDEYGWSTFVSGTITT